MSYVVCLIYCITVRLVLILLVYVYLFQHYCTGATMKTRLSVSFSIKKKKKKRKKKKNQVYSQLAQSHLPSRSSKNNLCVLIPCYPMGYKPGYAVLLLIPYDLDTSDPSDIMNTCPFFFVSNRVKRYIMAFILRFFIMDIAVLSLYSTINRICVDYTTQKKSRRIT